MSAPELIWLQDDGDYKGAVASLSELTWCVNQINENDTEYVRADLCDPQYERVTQLVDAAIAENTAANKRVTSRERKQYIRGRIEALKDLRAALRALEQGEG